MAYPESQGSCGGNVSDLRMELINAISIGFSVYAASGFAARTRVQRVNRVKKTISVTRMKRQFCLIQAPKSFHLLFLISNTEKRINNPKAVRTPPRSFCRTPSEHSSQKANPQTRRLIGRISAYPRLPRRGKNRNAIGNENTPINVITKYQFRNARISFKQTSFR